MSRARTQNGHFRGHNCEAGRADLIVGRAVVGAVVLVEEVRVCAERHGRGVSSLARDLDDGGPLGDQEADVAVAQVVWAGVRNAGGFGGVGEGAFAPVARAVGVPWRAVGGGEDEVGLGVAVGGASPGV